MGNRKSSKHACTLDYEHIFGPVPSRRLGMSLGIDLVPKKVCSLDCVYCEVGRTTKLTTERREYVQIEEVKDEISRYSSSVDSEPEYITFSGSGEPTLNCRIHDAIQFAKALKPNIPVAVLTNGTLLHEAEVRASLLQADVVLPSLDAACDKVFRRTNRPERTISVEKCIGGLAAFRSEYKGKMLLEVFILPGYNDATEHIAQLKDAIAEIGPDSVQLNTLDRPGAVRGIGSATRDELAAVAQLLGFPHTEIVSAAPQRKSIVSYREDVESAIVGTISRRPCTLDDLSRILGLHVSEVNKYLDVLESEGRIKVSYNRRGCFYVNDEGISHP